MTFYREMVKAIQFYVHAFRFIDKNKLYSFLLYPSILNLLAALFVGYLAWLTSGWLSNAFLVKINLSHDLSSLSNFLEIVISLLIKGFVLFFYLKIYRYIILIFYAPVYVFITEIVLCKLTGVRHKFHTRHFTLAIFRAMRTGAKNFFMEILLSLCVVIFTLTITWLLPLAPILLFIVESFFFASALADFRNFYAQLHEKESHELITHHPGMVLGNGVIFNFLLLVPLIGILFAPVLALVASILSFDSIDKKGEVYVPAIS